MKKLSVLLCTIFMAVLAAAFAACGGGALSKPVGLRINSDTLNLSWRAVANAGYYTVSINGTEFDSRTNSYSLSNLTSGEYELRVKARARGTENRDSGWSEKLEFIREAEPGMGFSLMNGKTEYAVISAGTAEGDIVIPDVYRGKPVTAIAEKAFANNGKITGVTLGNNITSIGAQAFYNCSYLAKANIPQTVTEIGEQAFQGCRLLNSPIEINDNITQIPDNAFAYCRSLTMLTIGKNVLSIGANAFADCNALTEISIPDGVESIGDYAFSSCSSATEIIVGAQTVTVGERAFYGCTSATTALLGGSLESLGNYAFAGCTSLEGINFPRSLTSIGEGAFMGCEKLGSVDIGANVSFIGPNAFDGSGLYTAAENVVYAGNWLVACKDKEVTGNASSLIRSGTVGIAGAAFENCKSITQVNLPNTVVNICDSAFEGCELLNQVAIGSGAKTLGNRAFFGCTALSVVRLGSYNLVQDRLTSVLESIGQYAFAGCTSLGATGNNIVIPDTVTTIGGSAFENTGLYENTPAGVVYAGNWAVDYVADRSGMDMLIYIDNGVVGISDYAFYSSSILYVQMPNTVTHLGRGAFYNNKSLQVAFLSEGLTEIPDYAFYGCSKLIMESLPANLTSIGRSAFYKCERLGTGEAASASGEYTLKIPSSVMSIGDYAFYGCGYTQESESGETVAAGITEVEIGNSARRIGDFAFANIPSLTRVKMGDGVTYLGDKAFYKCPLLEEVTLSSSITSIGEKTFYGCTSLKQATVPDSVIYLGDYAFYKCSALESVTIGNSVTSIGNYAFSGCTSLKEVNLPQSLTTIGKQAFRGAGLESVTIGGGVSRIYVHAFYGDNNLTIYSEQKAPASGWNARFNTSYRPVVWGVTLSPDKDYVYSFTMEESTLENFNELVQVGAPLRQGYTFGGWATSPGGSSAYTAGQITEIPVGTTVYAIWLNNTQ